MERSTTRPILNLTQHLATPDQAAAGVRDLDEATRARLVALLTFEAPPSPEEIGRRAEQIADLATGAPAALLGGATFLMSALERALRARGVAQLYAFTRRESRDELQPDGSVRKTAVFRHAGFVSPPAPEGTRE